MKLLIAKIYWIISIQFGLDPRRFFRGIRSIPLFIRDWVRFRRAYSGLISLMPCLHDRYEEAGAVKSEYFWQDLIVARWINFAQPKKHVDIGSRIDGFVAHVASFREIEVFDVRPITSRIPGAIFHQANLMDEKSLLGQVGEGYCDSLSCLHVLEHLGLGRYGDSIDHKGYSKGISNLARLLQANGILYLSTPIGIERVEFNANWVFNPFTIITVAANAGLELSKLVVIDSNCNMIDLGVEQKKILELTQQKYNLGIFVFIKSKSHDF